jgi:hypothetical protein
MATDKESQISLTQDNIFQFFAQCNLNLHIRHYNEHKRLVSNEIYNISQKIEKGGLDSAQKRELLIVKNYYLGPYHEHMVLNAFLMMYSHLEECLSLRLKSPSTNLRVSMISGLEGFKDGFKDRYSVSLAQAPQWLFLNDCSQFRHALLHAAGNINLANGRKLNPAMKRNPCLIQIKNKRLVLREQLLPKFAEAIPAFVEWVAEKIKQAKKPKEAR